jgi:hypothetical protein
MAKREFLGGFELLVLLALIRLGDDAYGVPISEAIEENSGREVALGSVYITLDRLQNRGLVSSELGEPTAGARGTSEDVLPNNGQRTSRGTSRTIHLDQVVAKRTSAPRRVSMSASQPPRLASWLLHHLASSPQRGIFGW